MTNKTELPDLDRLEALARAATPQDLDSAEDSTRPTGHIECPECGGDGTVELTADYCNYDGKAMGVQFYGIGPEHKAAEAFFRAANPSAVLALIALARRAQPEGEAVPVPTSVDMARLMLGMSYRWLKDNAPEHVPAGKPEGEAPQADTSGAHHLTAENVAAAIKDLREIEAGTTAFPVEHRDWRTQAGVLARIIEWLAAPAAQHAALGPQTAQGRYVAWRHSQPDMHNIPLWAGLDPEVRATWEVGAAQQAESGAPTPDAERVDAIVTGLYRRFKDWSKCGFGADDVTWCEVKADVVALIAAGAAESGAQAVDDGYEAEYLAGMTARERDLARTGRAEEIDRAALAAQPQGAQALDAVRGKLDAVWQGVRDAVAKYSGKPCEGEPFDRLDELLAALAAKDEAPALTPLDYRAQGREEALAIILAESAEDPFSAYTGWSKSGAPDDEGGAYWKEDELRALLNIGDRTHDAYDRAEAAYWEALGRKDEAERALLFAQQAPFYKPLHDFLSKHEAWDLLGDLKRAQQAAAPGALAGYVLVPKAITREMKRADGDAIKANKTFKERLTGGSWSIGSQQTVTRRTDEYQRAEAAYVAMLAAAPSAPGTPEAPAEQIAMNAARYEYLRDNMRFSSEPNVPAVMTLRPVLAPEHDFHKDWMEPRFGASVDRAVDSAIEKERAAQLDGGQGEGK